MRQAIVDNEDHESEVESDESVDELLIMKFLLSKLGLALFVSGEVRAHL